MAGWFYIVLLFIAMILFYIYSKTGKMLKCILFSAITGFSALMLLWKFGNILLLNVSITTFSVIMSAIMGIPGVLAMLIFNLI